MKKEHVMLGSNLLLSLTNHWVIIAVAIILTGAFGSDTPRLGLWLALWTIPVYYYATRVKVHNFYLFFLSQVLPLVVAFGAKVSGEIKFIWVVMTVFYMVSSIKIRLVEYSPELQIHPAVSVGIIGAGFWLEGHLFNYGWISYYTTLIFVYLIFYFFYYFVSQYLSFISVNRNTASNIPEKEIFTAGIKQTVVCVFGGVILMLLSINVEWLTYIINLLKRGLGALLRIMVYFFNLEKSNPGTVTSEKGSGGGGAPFFEITDPHPFWVFLEKVAMVAVFVGIVVFIIMGIIRGYQFLRRNFREVNKSKMKEITGNQDIRESCEVEKRAGEERGWFSFLNNTEKIRKMYRKRILKNKFVIAGEDGNEELRFLTAKECCDKISADSLKVIYEKARYSNEMVTSEEIRAVKSAEKAAR